MQSIALKTPEHTEFATHGTHDEHEARKTNLKQIISKKQFWETISFRINPRLDFNVTSFFIGRTRLKEVPSVKQPRSARRKFLHVTSRDDLNKSGRSKSGFSNRGGPRRSQMARAVCKSRVVRHSVSCFHRLCSRAQRWRPVRSSYRVTANPSFRGRFGCGGLPVGSSHCAGQVVGIVADKRVRDGVFGSRRPT